VKRQWQGRPANSCVFTLSGAIGRWLRNQAPHKELPADVLSWSEPALRGLMRGVIGGDGHTRKDDGRQSIIQKSESFIDDIQAVAIRLGYTAVTTERKDGVFACYLTHRPYRSLRGTGGKGVNIATVKYTGVVWCPQTEHGTFVARRNGSVFITGNTFPPDLIEPCIKAGTSERGACPKCGKAWVRVVKRTPGKSKVCPKTQSAHEARGGSGELSGTVGKSGGGRINGSIQTLGWRPACGCGICPDGDLDGDSVTNCSPEPVPCLVLDPFIGAGTTGLVAERLGRNWLGIDLNPEYAAMAMERIEADRQERAQLEMTF